MSNTKKITILHSNDMHGDFLAEQVDGSLVGGVSMLSGYINKVRSEEKNVIYAIAGDMFRGSIIDSEYKGISTIEIMNLLAPDVVTIGNHEIDYGIAHLLFIEKCARFPIINANMFVTTNGSRLFSPYLIMEIDGMNVLFIGIITKEVLNQAKQDPLIGTFIDTTEAAQEVGRICNAHNSLDIDFTVLLTHIGFEHDLELARMLDPAWGVDIIIGGHSHTFLDAPVTENGIIVVQAGTGTDQVGRFDIVVDTEQNCIDSFTWKSVPITDRTCPRDRQLETMIEKYKTVTDRKYGRVVTRFKTALTHPQRNQETALGNLFADIFRRSLGIDIMLLGSGSLRCESMGPIVEYGKLAESFPYDDSIHMLKITGEQLRKMVKYLLRDDSFLGITEFYQFSEGLRVVYSKSRRELESFTFNGKEIEDGDVFTVGIQHFHFSNLPDFFGIDFDEAGKLQKPHIISTSCLDILEEYMGEHQNLDGRVEGRIAIVE